ncbi:MAG: hypothetical protein WAL88_06110 [Nitrosotalea sp.]
MLTVNLLVRANDELTLDAGSTEPAGNELVIQPPKRTLFRQVLDYLRRKPDPPDPRAGTCIDHEGAAAATVALRWGSYLAVLADRDKPIWAETRSPGTSRIADPEMARINIEASAGLAEWIDLCREEPAVYEQLVLRAVAYLPLPKWRATPTGTDFAMLALPSVRAQMAREMPETGMVRVRADAEAHPSRVFANSLVNTAWRNGPIEEIHAGGSKGYPLDKRRVTAAEERSLMGSAIDRLTVGMEVARQLVGETPPRPWSEQVIPYALSERMLITPVGWTLTEETREVRLPRG